MDLRPTGTVPTAFAAQWLVSLIQTEAIHQYAAKKHVKASDQEIAQATQQFTGSGQSAAAFKQLPKWLQNQIVDTTALQLALRSTLKPTVSDAKLATAYQQLTADCPSKKLIGHILVATPEAAQQAIDRIEGRRELRHGRERRCPPTPAPSAQGGLLMCQDGSQWSQLDETFRAGAEAVPVGEISRAGADPVRLPRDRGARPHPRERASAGARGGAGGRPARAGPRQVHQAGEDLGQPALRHAPALRHVVHDQPADAEEGPQPPVGDVVDDPPPPAAPAQSSSATSSTTAPASP